MPYKCRSHFLIQNEKYTWSDICMTLTVTTTSKNIKHCLLYTSLFLPLPTKLAKGSGELQWAICIAFRHANHLKLLAHLSNFRISTRCLIWLNLCNSTSFNWILHLHNNGSLIIINLIPLWLCIWGHFPDSTFRCELIYFCNSVSYPLNCAKFNSGSLLSYPPTPEHFAQVAVRTAQTSVYISLHSVPCTFNTYIPGLSLRFHHSCVQLWTQLWLTFPPSLPLSIYECKSELCLHI